MCSSVFRFWQSERSKFSKCAPFAPVIVDHQRIKGKLGCASLDSFLLFFCVVMEPPQSKDQKQGNVKIICKIVQNPKETTYQRIRLLSILYTSLAKDRENPEFGIASHSVNPLSEVGAGLQGSFNLGGVHGLVLGQVLLQTCASDRARVAYASSRYLRQNSEEHKFLT